VVVLDQKRPQPIVAVGWSKAVGVSGSPNADYSLYLDILYQDDTPLWGQVATFDTGTHGWQRRERLVVPDKPIKQVSVHAIFRRHTGTAYFDDFALYELSAKSGTCLFDGTPVHAPSKTPSVSPGDSVALRTGDGLALMVSKSQGAVFLGGSETGRGGFMVRDAAAGSDICWVDANVRVADGGATLKGGVESLAIELEAELRAERDHIRVDGLVSSTRAEDRALSFYFVLPFRASGGRWYDDVRTERAIEPNTRYQHTTYVGAGTNQQMSPYPLSCVATPDRALCLGIPMDEPRLFRLGYDSAWHEHYLAFDFGLASEPKRFPNRATFSFLIYQSDPTWGFRAALKEYYEIFPQFFEKRVPREGLWMAFTDISTVQQHEDFHFAFHEGNNNVPWDDDHDILTFVYTEPMTNWMSMPGTAPRTYEGAMAQLEQDLASASKYRREQSITTRLSGVRTPDGRYDVGILKAPWCDGGVFALNANPTLATTEQDYINQGQFELSKIERAFDTGVVQSVGHWRAYGTGYETDREAKRGGEQSLRCSCAAAGEEHGAAQTVYLAQQTPKPLVLRGWSRAERVTGERGNNYAIYVDLVLDDGSPLWGQIAPFSSGTHDWELSEYVIQPRRLVAQATVHVLFRRTHTGTVWFDDLFLGEQGSDTNLLRNPGFEPVRAKPPVLDGAYVDSLEGWAAARNFDRRQFRDIQIPLTFDTQSKKPIILNIFSTYEFVRELERRMRARGKLTMANSVPHRFPFFGHLLDVMGTETDWHRDRKWQPMSDRALNLKRATCYQKPYCFLMNTHYEDFSFELVERYMKRSLFYGCFPGMFSEDAATNTYFSNPTWYNRDRPLFSKYIPLVQKIAKAGWEPITHARTNVEQVYVERYGSARTSGLFFTVLNDGQASSSFELRVHAAALGVNQGAAVKELIHRAPVGPTWEDGVLLIRSSLDSEDALLYSILTEGE